MSEIFKLPGSSYGELIKIIKAYGATKPDTPVQLSELSQSTGIPTTGVSRNNGFLVQQKLVTEGTKKVATDICRKLASAYNNNLNHEVQMIWKNIIKESDFLLRMLLVLENKCTMERNEYIGHIIHSSGQLSSSASRSGAATIIEILKIAEVIEENDGNYYVSKEKSCSSPKESIPINNGAVIKAPPCINTQELPHQNPTPATDDYFIQPYTCESGKIAEIRIPNDATKDDLLLIKDMLLLVMKRKYKLDLTE
ncbi:MAG: hypothetical protein Q4F78_00770 [Bacillota bacterium]|nr:hypothetical protein [Bacillota bacterium]